MNHHIEEFSRVIASGNGTGATFLNSPLITTHVKVLQVHQGSEEGKITNPALALLESAIPELCRLERLSWRLFFVPKSLKIFKLLQTRCPQLDSVELLIPEDFRFKTKLGKIQYKTLLDFKDLTNFSLEITSPPRGIETEYIQPLKALLTNSPALEFLQLNLDDTWSGASERTYSPELIAMSLGEQFTLPRLRKLKILGSIELAEKGLLAPPSTGTYFFREFLSRHTRLEDLTLECYEIVAHFRNGINPEDLATALPSLKRFQGPEFICDQLVRSSLAAQLENLIIDESSFEQGLDFALDGQYDIRPLPMLRELDIGTNRFPDALDILKAIMPTANGLQVLRLGSYPFYH
ncbi:hypothetical protein FRC11_000555, partial [Ceratobasidium sp. 423]